MPFSSFTCNLARAPGVGRQALPPESSMLQQQQVWNKFRDSSEGSCTEISKIPSASALLLGQQVNLRTENKLKGKYVPRKHKKKNQERH